MNVSTRGLSTAGIVVVATLFGPMTPQADAQIPSNGVFYACIRLDHDQDESRSFRLVAQDEPCRSREARVSWSATGPAGPIGPVGPKGATGPAGPAGAPGAVGATGPAGAAGPTGAAGPKGDAGAPGATGPQGLQGTNGTNGTDGTNGTNGTDGVSGYQQLSASTSIGAGVEVIGTLGCPNGKKAIGGGWKTDTNNLDVNVIGSAPTDDGSAWTGGMMNKGTSTAQLTLYVICMAVQ